MLFNHKTHRKRKEFPKNFIKAYGFRSILNQTPLCTFQEKESKCLKNFNVIKQTILYVLCLYMDSNTSIQQLIVYFTSKVRKNNEAKGARATRK